MEAEAYLNRLPMWANKEKFLKGYPYIFRSDGRTGP